MKWLLYIVVILGLGLYSNPLSAQLDSIYDQGAWRTFIVHLPPQYDQSNQYPIVVNLHGLNSNAAQQQTYSQFDVVADSLDFIVVYPNGESGQWEVAGNKDVDFISHLIDTLRNRYSTNNCLFVNGMSAGGFMTYKLACALPQPITAVAVVAGNMARTLQNSCDTANPVPVMHFHGTADGNFNGAPPLIPPVDSTILWWVNHNISNPNPTLVYLPDTNTADSCYVEHHTYWGVATTMEVSYYRIIGGGHTWPGANPVPALGHTNQDINASALMGDFFMHFCSLSTAVPEERSFGNPVSIHPNPALSEFTVAGSGRHFSVRVYDGMGRRMYAGTSGAPGLKVDCSAWREGLYWVTIQQGKETWTSKLVILR